MLLPIWFPKIPIVLAELEIMILRKRFHDEKMPKNPWRICINVLGFS